MNNTTPVIDVHNTILGIIGFIILFIVSLGIVIICNLLNRKTEYKCLDRKEKFYKIIINVCIYILSIIIIDVIILAIISLIFSWEFTLLFLYTILFLIIGLAFYFLYICYMKNFIDNRDSF